MRHERASTYAVRLAAAAFLVGSCVAGVAPTAAHGVVQPLTPHEVARILRPAPGIHVLPPVPVARKIAASLRPNAVGNMTYHGGAVMQQANNSVAIFWMPPTLQDGTDATPSASYINLVTRYFADIGGSPLYQTTTQYYQTINGPTEYIVNASG